jgi:hypothetical protein
MLHDRPGNLVKTSSKTIKVRSIISWPSPNNWPDLLMKGHHEVVQRQRGNVILTIPKTCMGWKKSVSLNQPGKEWPLPSNYALEGGKDQGTWALEPVDTILHDRKHSEILDKIKLVNKLFSDLDLSVQKLPTKMELQLLTSTLVVLQNCLSDRHRGSAPGIGIKWSMQPSKSFYQKKNKQKLIKYVNPSPILYSSRFQAYIALVKLCSKCWIQSSVISCKFRTIKQISLQMGHRWPKWVTSIASYFFNS